MTEIPNADVQKVTDELTIIEAFANELETYLVQGNIYRTLLISTTSGQRKMTMSGGDLLVRLNRLREQYAVLSLEQQGRFEHVASQVQRTMDALRTRFHDLLRRELKARTDQLNWNVDVRLVSERDKADPAELQNRQHIAAIKAALNDVS